MIIGRDLIRSLSIDIHGAYITIHWDNAAIPWRDIYPKTNNVFMISQYNEPFNSKTKWMSHILVAKYTKSDLKFIAESSTCIDVHERKELYTLLNNHESSFGGNLGTWHGKPYEIKLRQDTEPYH